MSTFNDAIVKNTAYLTENISYLYLHKYIGAINIPLFEV